MGYYDYGYSSDTDDLISLLVESLFSLAINSIMSIACYVFLALGLYTIAKRRGINHPWLAWVPIGSTWLLGCISDQYRYIVHRQEKNKRKIMLALNILLVVVCIVLIVVIVMMCINLAPYIDFEEPFDLDEDALIPFADRIFSYTGIIGFCGLLTLGLSIAQMVLTYMAYYDLFASCEPGNKTLYLVLGMLISVAMPVLVFICRTKDLGMPPRRDSLPPQPEPWTPPAGQWNGGYQPPVQTPPQPTQWNNVPQEPWTAPTPTDPWESNQ